MISLVPFSCPPSVEEPLYLGVLQELNDVSPRIGVLEEVGRIRFPYNIPTHWEKGRTLSPTMIHHALKDGWKLVRPGPVELSRLHPDTHELARRWTLFPLLLPPEEILAALVRDMSYDVLQTAGIVESPRASLVPPDFSHSTGTCLEQLLDCLVGYCLEETHCVSHASGDHPDGASSLLSEGGAMVSLSGMIFLLGPETLRRIGLSTSELRWFYERGLMGLHLGTSPLGTELSPWPPTENVAHVGDPMDLRAFVSRTIKRWRAPLRAVVSEADLSRGTLTRYPELVVFLRAHLPLLTRSERDRCEALLHLMELAISIEHQRGIANHIAGILAGLVLRTAILRHYQGFYQQDSEAILLLKDDVLDRRGLFLADAMVVSFDGSQRIPQVRVHSLLEVTLSMSQAGVIGAQLSRRGRQIIPEMILREGERRYAVSAVLDEGLTEHALILDHIGPTAAGEIRSVMDQIKYRAVRQLQTHSFGVPVSRRDLPRETRPSLTPLYRPVGGGLYFLTHLTIAQLDEVALEEFGISEGTPTTLYFSGCVESRGASLDNIAGFHILCAQPEAVSYHHFLITISRDQQGIWRVTSVDRPSLEGVGGKVDQVLQVMRSIPGLYIPSLEWLSRALPRTLSALVNPRAWEGQTTELFDQWADEFESPIVDGERQLVLIGICERGQEGDTFTGFDVRTQIPPALHKVYFTVTLRQSISEDFRSPWRVASVTRPSQGRGRVPIQIAGNNILTVLQVLRQVKRLDVPSVEWLGREIHGPLSSFVDFREWLSWTPQDFERWADEFGARSLEKRRRVILTGNAGTIHRDGRVRAFKVVSEIPAQLHDDYFVLTFDEFPGDPRPWHLTDVTRLVPVLQNPSSLYRIIGVNVPTLLDQLERVEWMLVPSREWLGRDLPEKGLTALIYPEKWKEVTTHQLDRWALEFADAPVGKPADLVLRGNLLWEETGHKRLQRFRVHAFHPESQDFNLWLKRQDDFVAWISRDAGGRWVLKETHCRHLSRGEGLLRGVLGQVEGLEICL